LHPFAVAAVCLLAIVANIPQEAATAAQGSVAVPNVSALLVRVIQVHQSFL